VADIASQILLQVKELQQHKHINLLTFKWKNMKVKKNERKGNFYLPAGISPSGLARLFSFLVILTVLMAGCEKHKIFYTSEDPFAAPGPQSVTGISQVMPSNLSEDIPVDQVVNVTFNQVTDPAVIASSTLALNAGNTIITASKSLSGSTVTFTPDTDLAENTEYTALLKTSEKGASGVPATHEYSWKFKTGKKHNGTAPSIISVSPADGATNVPVTSQLSVTFDRELNQSFSTLVKIDVRNGTTGIPGTLSFSGSVAIFKPTASLAQNTSYTVTISTGRNDDSDSDDSNDNDDDEDDDDDEGDYSSLLLKSWSFSTGSSVPVSDVTAPVVNSVFPANSATSVAISASLTINFSEAMDASTITSGTIILKQGSASVAGTVTYSGTVATFKPSSSLTTGTVYTASVTTGVKDVAGNALASAYSWTFTTVAAASADNTPPTVVSVVPASNATSVAVNATITASFSEAMNASTITSATFTLYKGTTAVTGSVSYSGTTATFLPATALAGNTVYTVTITTGAKDAAGNSLSANYTWSFTTVVTVAQISFASTVVPILNKCNTCHTHQWTTSAVASTFYANLVSGGYVNPTSPTTGKIYTKLNSGHPGSTVTTAEVNTILTWMQQGAKNN
jgi:hypothetical protein